MSTSVAISLNQLASLIGELAFPDPNGGDSIVHGPGGPRARANVLAEVRHVTISVIEWAERIVEQNAIASSITESTKQETESAPAPTLPGNANPDPANSPTPDQDCGPQPDDVRIKKPPASAVEQFVCDLVQGNGPARLPIPAGSGVNPWKLSIASGSLRTLSQLVSAAQFQFAAEATQFEISRALFQWSAQRLIDHALQHLGHNAPPQLRSVA